MMENDVTSPNAHRYFWQIIEFVFGLFSIFYGADYAVLGNKFVKSPSLNILERIPGHMHTHGVVMLLIGMALIFEALTIDRTTKHPALMIFTGYCLFVAFTEVGSWWITNYPPTGAIFWLAFAVIALGAIKYPPGPKVA